MNSVDDDVTSLYQQLTVGLAFLVAKPQLPHMLSHDTLAADIAQCWQGSLIGVHGVVLRRSPKLNVSRWTLFVLESSNFLFLYLVMFYQSHSR